MKLEAIQLMNQRRLLYRVILKLLTALALLVLFGVFINSLFVSDSTLTTPKESVSLVTLDISDMRPGEIRKTRWNGRDVAILRRTLRPTNAAMNVSPDDAQPLKYPDLRSIKPDYFVFINQGDSANCPLYYAQNQFRDICSGTLFDTTGRRVQNPKSSDRMQIPPHYFENNQLIIGKWNKID